MLLHTRHTQVQGHVIICLDRNSSLVNLIRSSFYVVMLYTNNIEDIWPNTTARKSKIGGKLVTEEIKFSNRIRERFYVFPH